jgi:hypothetical protein
MAERTNKHADLERALTDLAGDLDFPRDRDLAPSVRARIQAGSSRRQPWWTLAGPRRQIAVAALAVLVVVAGVVGMSSDARDTVANRLGLSGVSISTDPTAPAATVTGELGANLRLGAPVTLDEALAEAGYDVVAPPVGLRGAPDEVYLLEAPGGPQVSYVYHPAPNLPEIGDSGVGLLISQFEGHTNESFIQKQMLAGTTLTVVSVNGHRGFWLSGEPHVFYYADPSGTFREESIRLAGNVLLWERDGITLRIESALPLEQVLPIAAAMTAESHAP